MKTIKYDNLPQKLPIVSTAVAYLILDKFQAHSFVWGIIGTMFFIFWAVSIINLIISEQVDVFEVNNKNKDK